MMVNTKTYKVNDIAQILKISRTKAYEIVNRSYFPIIHIGKALRIPVEPFERWMLSQYEQNEQSTDSSIKYEAANTV